VHQEQYETTKAMICSFIICRVNCIYIFILRSVCNASEKC
jgi:hypothetical protein